MDIYIARHNTAWVSDICTDEKALLDIDISEYTTLRRYTFGSSSDIFEVGNTKKVDA